jgi:hypothetical protein
MLTGQEESGRVEIIPVEIVLSGGEMRVSATYHMVTPFAEDVQTAVDLLPKGGRCRINLDREDLGEIWWRLASEYVIKFQWRTA